MVSRQYVPHFTREKFLQVYVNNETGEPMDILLPEVKDWAKSLGVEVSTVTDIVHDKPQAVCLFYL